MPRRVVDNVHPSLPASFGIVARLPEPYLLGDRQRKGARFKTRRVVVAQSTSLIPELAPFFRLTPAALYERQRALVRLHHLPAPEGRGRGSGAEASPETLAKLVLAAMATDNLSDLKDSHLINRLMFARCDEVRKLTGRERFRLPRRNLWIGRVSGPSPQDQSFSTLCGGSN